MFHLFETESRVLRVITKVVKRSEPPEGFGRARKERDSFGQELST